MYELFALLKVVTPPQTLNYLRFQRETVETTHFALVSNDIAMQWPVLHLLLVLMNHF